MNQQMKILKIPSTNQPINESTNQRINYSIKEIYRDNQIARYRK